MIEIGSSVRITNPKSLAHLEAGGLLTVGTVVDINPSNTVGEHIRPVFVTFTDRPGKWSYAYDEIEEVVSIRTFYRTTITVEVLTEGAPYQLDTLQDLHYDITFGECSGDFKVASVTRLDGYEAAQALIAQGSSPEFFGLDGQGYDMHL